MLKGRLGLDPANIRQADRHGLLWLKWGQLYAEAGTLKFRAAESEEFKAGIYDIPFQTLSCILLQPGTSVTHDALRLLAAHGTGLLAVGEGAVRLYASLPSGPDASALARRHARLWNDSQARIAVARKMYAMRLGEVFPYADLDRLRGMEGVRVRKMYKLLAMRHGISWRGRRYDREAPETNDMANNAINHASAAVLACAEVAVAVAGAIPQLGFIHEDSSVSFPLDIADLHRHDVTVDCAFAAVARCRGRPSDLERTVRRMVGQRIRERRLVAAMIDQVKALLTEPPSREPGAAGGNGGSPPPSEDPASVA